MNSMFIGALDHHSTFYGDNDFDVIERLAERHSRVELGGVGNGYSIVTRYDMIRRVTGRPELFMRPSA